MTSRMNRTRTAAVLMDLTWPTSDIFHFPFHLSIPYLMYLSAAMFGREV